MKVILLLELLIPFTTQTVSSTDDTVQRRTVTDHHRSATVYDAAIVSDCGSDSDSDCWLSSDQSKVLELDDGDEAGKFFNTHLNSLAEVYREVIHIDDNGRKKKIEDKPATLTSFVINAHTIIQEFHDTYKFYLPVPSYLSQNKSAGSASFQDAPESVEDPTAYPQLSLQCQRDVLAIYAMFNFPRTNMGHSETDNLVFRNLWSLKMLDSWGKSGDGVLAGNLRRLGFMEECLSVLAHIPAGEAALLFEETRSPVLTFAGQYCLVQTQSLVKGTQRRNVNRDSNSSFMGVLPPLYGTCIPSSCTAAELKDSLDYQLAALQYRAAAVSCQTSEDTHPFGWWEWGASVVLGALVVAVLAGSAVHLYSGGKSTSVATIFSAPANLKKIFAVKSIGDGEISCIYGIRVFSMSWIILGHQYAYIVEYGVNLLEMPQKVSNWQFQLVWSGYKSVDTFFTIGGLLLAKTLLSKDFCAVKTARMRPTKRLMSDSNLISTHESEDVESAARARDNVDPGDVLASSGSSDRVSVSMQEQHSSNGAVHCNQNRIKENAAPPFTLSMVKSSLLGFLINYPIYLLHRVLRMVPTLFVVVLFCAGLSWLFVAGPYKSRYEQEYLEGCRTNWWVDLTLFSNVILRVTGVMAETDPDYNKPVDSCISHSWYAAVDFQLYLLAPLLLLPMKLLRHQVLYLSGLTLLLCLIPGLIVVLEGLMPAMLLTLNNQESVQYARAVYMMPYARAPPYFVGALAGLLLHKAEDAQQYRESCTGFRWLALLTKQWCLALGWVVYVVASLALLLGLAGTNTISLSSPPQPMNDFASFMYASFASAAWAVCVSWVVVTCSLGLAGPVNEFLSHPMWQPLSRVTFPVYLISLPIQKMVFYSFQRDLYLTHTTIILSCCGVIFISHLAALLISLIAEAPFINISKKIFG